MEAQNIPHVRIENENEIEKYYTLQKVLGQGAFGVVHLAIEKSTQNKYACKTIKKKLGSVSTYEQQEREVAILKILHHVNICQLVAVYESSKSIALVLELCEGGELVDFVKDQKKVLPDSQIREIITQLLTAVTYLHRNRIVHRDIKPENILLKSKNEIVIKMADFGLACFTDGIYQVDNIAGTPLYMAPEIVQKLGYNHSCDIWSIGIMLYLMLCKYQKNSEEMLHEMVCKGKIEYPDFLWKKIDPRGANRINVAKQLTEMILRFDPAKRISAGEILVHPWITDQAGNSANNNVLDLMKSYNAERRMRKALLVVRAVIRFRGAIPNKTAAKLKISGSKDRLANSKRSGSKGAIASLAKSEKVIAPQKTEKSVTSLKNEKSVTSTKNEKLATSTKNDKSVASTKNEKPSALTKNEKPISSTKPEKSVASTKTEKSIASLKPEKSSVSVTAESSVASVRVDQSNSSLKNENSTLSLKAERSIKPDSSSLSLKSEKSVTSRSDTVKVDRSDTVKADKTIPTTSSKLATKDVSSTRPTPPNSGSGKSSKPPAPSKFPFNTGSERNSAAGITKAAASSAKAVKK